MPIESKLSPYQIALVPIRSSIATGDKLLPFVKAIPSMTITSLLDKLAADKKTKALLLEINCGGGTPYACEDIARHIRSFGKPTAAWITEKAASGGYWIASACDYIVADKLSIVGSIGVISLRLDLSSFLEKLAISVDTLANDPHKLFGFPTTPITPDENKEREHQLQVIQQQFLNAILTKRKVANDAINISATGKAFLGEEAKPLGLIDELGGQTEALATLCAKAGLKRFRIVDYSKQIETKKRGMLAKLLLGE